MAHQFPKRCCDKGVVITLCGPPPCCICMASGQLLVVLIPCVPPVLPLYDWWVSTCGTYPMCGPIVTTVRLVGIYLGAYSVCGFIVTCTTVWLVVIFLWCLPRVWPHYYMYHCTTMGTYLWYLPCVWPQCYNCMTGGYLLVVLTPCVAPLLPLFDWWYLLVVLTPCVAPVSWLYGWWVSTCGTYPVCGPSVTTVWPVVIYLWCLPLVWPHCYRCNPGLWRRVEPDCRSCL